MTKAIADLKSEILLILSLFVISRIFLTLIGYTANTRTVLGSYRTNQETYSDYPALNIWGIWDTSWYINIARYGYTKEPIDLPKISCCGQRNLGFFPLYPFLIFLLQKITGDYFISGIIISNLSLIASAFILYKLTSLNSKRQEAADTVKFLFAFPASFILSGVLSESVFLLLLLVTFYFAKTKRWLWSGVAGYFLALTRPNGIIVVLPIIFEYLRSIDFKIKKISKESLYLVLFPLGTLTFGIISFLQTNDFFAFWFIKKNAWGANWANPLSVFYNSFFAPGGIAVLIGIPVLLSSLLLFWNYRKTELSYLFLGFLFILFTLANGFPVALGYLRTSVTIFPLYIILGKIKNNVLKNIFLVLSLALQGALMVAWSNGIYIM